MWHPSRLEVVERDCYRATDLRPPICVANGQLKTPDRRPFDNMSIRDDSRHRFASILRKIEKETRTGTYAALREITFQPNGAIGKLLGSGERLWIHEFHPIGKTTEMTRREWRRAR